MSLGVCKSSLKAGRIGANVPGSFVHESKELIVDMIDTDRQISGLCGHRSLLQTVRDVATQLINMNPGMKAAEALTRVGSQFQELFPEATESRIKNRIPNAKSLN